MNLIYVKIVEVWDTVSNTHWVCYAKKVLEYSFSIRHFFIPFPSSVGEFCFEARHAVLRHIQGSV